MIPLSLHARNLRTFETLDLQLEDGCSAITGEILNAPDGISSNGAGKSTLAMLPALALFGKAAGRPLAKHATRGGMADDVEVGMMFQHGGDTFRVRRGYSTKGKGKPHLDLEQLVDGVYLPLTRETVKETQALIEDVTGLTETTFRCSGYLAQKDGSALTLADPADRMDALVKALFGPRPVWPRLQEFARAERRAAEAEVAKLNARLERADEELAERAETERSFIHAENACTEAGQLLAEAERALEAATVEWQQAQERTTERRALEAEAEAARQKVDALRAREDAAQATRGSLVAAHAELAALPSPQDVAAAEERYSEARAAYSTALLERQALQAQRMDADTQWRALTAEQQTLASRAGELQAQVERLQAPTAASEPCALCQRPLDDERARHRVIESHWSDLSAIDVRTREIFIAVEVQEDRIRRLGEQLEATAGLDAPPDSEVQRARQQATERARIEERIGAWRTVIAEVQAPAFQAAKQEAAEQHAGAEARLDGLPPIDQADLDRIKAAGVTARADANKARLQLDNARADKARYEATLARLTAVAAQADTERQQRDQQQARLDDLHVLERAYGRDGIPSLIVENVAIPLIEQETNRVLQELGTAFRVQLRTQRVKKDGDLKSTLQIIVVDEAGNEDEYVAYSGGETTRVDIALRVGLAVYMKTHGDGSGILIIDEPEGLDDAGMAALVRVMRRLEGLFPRLILVSHVPMLRDAFDNVVHVVRDGAVSRVEALEAVAA